MREDRLQGGTGKLLGAFGSDRNGGNGILTGEVIAQINIFVKTSSNYLL